MGYKDRIKLYKQIEDYRKKPLIVYITSGRPGKNVAGRIASDAVKEFTDQLFELPSDTKEIDIIINSYGGDGLTSWRLISLIREFLGPKGKITSLVPFYAFSAGTLFAVGSNQIFLHPMASLGPVDPQITVQRESGKQQQFAYEDLSAYTNFLKEEGGLTEQSEKAKLLDLLVREIQPSVIGKSKRSSMQSKIMTERLLKLHMPESEVRKAEMIAEKLNKSYFSHGHAVSRKEAEDLGLKIDKRDETLEKLIWSVYMEFEKDMKMKQVFDPIIEYLNDPAAEPLMQPPPVVNIPENAPPAVVQQIWQNVLNNMQTNQGPVIDYELFQAAIESKNLSSKYITKGKIFGTRKPDLNFTITTPILQTGWNSEKP